jgi:DNA-binding NarL/FixJ family response regulator
MRIAVGVIEDHPLYRAALGTLLGETNDIEVNAVAESVAQFTARRRVSTGVVVLGLNLPGRPDPAAVLRLVELAHQVLVVSANVDEREMLAAMAAGARGYLSKSAEGTEIVRAVREIAAGKNYVAPALASLLPDTGRERQAGPVIELSIREREVLSLVAAGERDQDIAHLLTISIRTVRSYLDRIRDKTGHRRRSELTRYAIENGILRGRRPITRMAIVEGRSEGRSEGRVDVAATSRHGAVVALRS